MQEVDIPEVHWADHAATSLLASKPNQNIYVCAAGISPSGVVHIGNFREVITVDFVVRSLRERGKTVRFLYSWDDYDALRKVPKNLPHPELIEENLRRPIAKIPDPFKTSSSYARHFEELFEGELSRLAISPEYVYQCDAYERGRYVEGIRTALAHENRIRQILNAARTTDLGADWTTVTIYCSQCGRDTTEKIRYQPPNFFSYRCTSCNRDGGIDITKEPGVKLLWRVDWPMRWNFEQVDFEPGGKDHSSTGGSFETGAEISRSVFLREPPGYVQYDFVLVKGIGTKLSSSTGNLITLTQALEIYEPQVIRWIFASRKPNIDFSISFDLDVMKAYDDFDRSERIAHGREAADDKKRNYESRIYFFSALNPSEKPTEMPPQFGFRHLCNILQIHQGDLERVANHYGVTSARDRARLESRATRAWRWIQEYSPEEFRFKLRSPGDGYKSQSPKPLSDLATLLDSASGQSEEALQSQIFDIIKLNGLAPRQFFEIAYEALIRKKSGPKLANFLLATGPEVAAKILRSALPNA